MVLIRHLPKQHFPDTRYWRNSVIRTWFYHGYDSVFLQKNSEKSGPGLPNPARPRIRLRIHAYYGLGYTIKTNPLQVRIRARMRQTLMSALSLCKNYFELASYSCPSRFLTLVIFDWIHGTLLCVIILNSHKKIYIYIVTIYMGILFKPCFSYKYL